MGMCLWTSTDADVDTHAYTHRCESVKVLNITSHGGVQIKTTVGHQFTPTRIKLGRLKTPVSEDMGKHPPTNGRTKWCSHSATAQFLVTLNMQGSPDSASPFPGIYPKQMATYAHKQAWTRILTAASLTTAKNWKLHGRMDKQPWNVPATKFSSAIKRVNKPMPYEMWAKKIK